MIVPSPWGLLGLRGMTGVLTLPLSNSRRLQMEHCDRGSLAGAIKRGLFQPSERWGRGTALRALIRTAKEVAQVRACLLCLLRGVDEVGWARGIAPCALIGATKGNAPSKRWFIRLAVTAAALPTHHALAGLVLPALVLFALNICELNM